MIWEFSFIQLSEQTAEWNVTLEQNWLNSQLKEKDAECGNITKLIQTPQRATLFNILNSLLKHQLNDVADKWHVIVISDYLSLVIMWVVLIESLSATPDAFGLMYLWSFL